jgi:hypothetical protein
MIQFIYFLILTLNFCLYGIVFSPCISWVKASENDVSNYKSAVLCSLRAFHLPAAALLCTDMCCKDVSHHTAISQSAISQYAEAVTSALLSAAQSNIPHTNRRDSGTRCISGWSERVEPLRQKSLFWHRLWVDCGRPRNGVVADCMRRIRANYHYAVRQVKRDEELIVRDRIATALIEDPSRNFWAEVKKIRRNQVCSSKIVYGCTDETSIAQLFVRKYRSLYSSVPFDTFEMQDILHELDARVSDVTLGKADHIINSQDVLTTIGRLNVHKNDGN